MLKRRIRKKRWLDARSIKIRDRRKKDASRQGASFLAGTNNNPNKAGKIYYATAPGRFSIYENHEETADFFVSILNEIKNRNFHETFYFDFLNVRYVSIESIVYIIAILRNIKTKKYLHYEFKGNFPDDANAKQVFIESGFLNYVTAKKLKIPKSTDNVQILTGNLVDPAEAKRICDFAEQTNIISRKQRRILYNILIELMTNTVQHAYNYDKLTDSYLIPAWFIYCEHKNDKVICNFVDIGDGIPQTIHKKFLKDLFLNDSSAILSALNGELRTETRNSYRGKGLPYLKKCVIDGSIINFKVMSGKGSCSYLNGMLEFVKKEYDKNILGSIYYWEMERSA